MHAVSKKQIRSLVSSYKRPGELPILFRFSGAFISETVDDLFKTKLEESLGSVDRIWCEPIPSDDMEELSILIRKSGGYVDGLTHYMYGVFPNWFVGDNIFEWTVMDLVFNGDKDYMLYRNGSQIVFIRRVCENSSEYNARVPK